MIRRGRFRSGALTAWLGFIAAIAFVILPVVLVLRIGLDATGAMRWSTAPLSYKPIKGLLEDQAWSDALIRSFELGALATVAALAVGSLAAYVNLRSNWAGRVLSAGLMILPAAVPTVVFALGLVLFSSRLGIDTRLALIIGHAMVSSPFVFLVMRIGLSGLRPELVESSRMLGASASLTFFYVVLPQLLPFLFVAASFAMSISLAEPVLAIFLLNDSSATLPQKSFQGLRHGFDPLIMTSATLIVIVLLLLATVSLVVLIRQTRLQNPQRNAG
jgi:putative spermidine/putrescine transport system permease protein